MISDAITRMFPADVRGRGDTYYSAGRATIIDATETALTAAVSGTEEYVVQLLAERRALVAMCTCPYAADNGVCKHIWATLRQAESNGRLAPMLRVVGQGAALKALADDDYDDPGEVEAELDSDEWEEPPYDDTNVRQHDLPYVREPKRSPPSRARNQPSPARPAVPSWKAMLDTARAHIEHAATMPGAPADAAWPDDRRIIYIIDLFASRSAHGIVVELATEQRLLSGEWKAPVRFGYSVEAWRASPDAADRQLAQSLVGAIPQRYSYDAASSRPSTFLLSGSAIVTMLPLLCATGRCRARTELNERPMDALRWDDGAAWTLALRVERSGAGHALAAVLRRATDEMSLSEPVMLHSQGVLVARGAAARFEPGRAFPLVHALRGAGAVSVADKDVPALLESLYALPHRPPIDLPPDTQVSEVREPPVRGVAIGTDRAASWRSLPLRIEPFFLYGGVRVDVETTASSLFDRTTLTVRHRDPVHEAAARARLFECGAREAYQYAERRVGLTLGHGRLQQFMSELGAEGWHVEADGVRHHRASHMRASVRSGVDWFELDAGVRFGDIDVSLYDMLMAQRSGAVSIQLSDGTRGLLPLEWLASLGPLAAGAAPKDGVLRYRRSQTALLDALLATIPDVDVDAKFERARTQLATFSGIAPSDPPATFRGTLREYQRAGLAWLEFLRTFGLGGCLADDMGLGKTVQVLAMLDARRAGRAKRGRPSILVVPRSLVFNWLREAERFTPRLRIHDHTGLDRNIEDCTGAKVDVVLTTYGMLRRDAPELATIEFDYAILDEAQAIKNAGSASAKAARLLRAEHRLAMTGTPIENRIEELWSLFEFLNPGMLGASSSFAAFARLATGAGAAPSRDVLARALRPVILRRTKEQVASDLPARVEQTLSVDLEGTQRKFYDDLLETYRRSVLGKIDRVGLAKSKMHILEALLRLRQAACHPALVDAKRATGPSAKLDALMPALEQIIAEGHKVLVFSQFTSFLGHVRARLDAAGTVFEYLDGQVRDRQARVDRFQNDADCRLFLISLKAGGHGLNLTAADYVFILDPWWNPAVEAQAIDRAHRIGQTRPVMATRIVARGTIEEKILELQASKRALADAILGQDQGVLTGIGRAELEMLFS